MVTTKVYNYTKTITISTQLWSESMEDRFTGWILTQKDQASWIKIADVHIQSMQQLGSKFVLPVEHHVLKPFIDRFKDDGWGLAEYILRLRDMSNDKDQKRDLHELYRTIMTRFMQQDLRARTNRAVERYQKDNNKVFSAIEKQAYKNKLNAVWALGRLEYMKTCRGTKKRLTTDERAIALKEFWATIDEKIDNGDIPDDE